MDAGFAARVAGRRSGVNVTPAKLLLTESLDTLMPGCYFPMWSMLSRYYNSRVSASVRSFMQRFERVKPLLSALLTGMAFGVVLYFCIQIVPVYVKSYEFEKAAQKEARLAAFNSETEDAIHGDLYQKARSLGLPVEWQNIKIGSSAVEAPATLSDLTDPNSHVVITGVVNIEVFYAVPVAFPGYTLRLNFHWHADETNV